MEKLKIYRYQRGEELVNIATHAAGALFAVAGTVILIVFSALQRDPWKIVSSAVFGASMILLYSASALYHGSKNEKVRHIMNLIDHISIFYLIAGTYTPYLHSVRTGDAARSVGMVAFRRRLGTDSCRNRYQNLL